jgi:protein-disulfide isomerase
MNSLRDRLSQLGSVVLVLCAVLITATVVRREFFTRRPTAGPVERDVPGWRRLAADGHSVLGRADAPVKIVTFSDFQCPFCAQVNAEVDRIRAQDTTRVAIVYRHFPLEALHPHAFAAAMAAECAGAQGRFEAYHDALFAAQAEIGTRSWRSFAESAGVPSLDAFDACVKDQRFAGVVRRDQAAGREIGVSGTPTFIFDGKMVVGLPGAEKLEGQVRRALGS